MFLVLHVAALGSLLAGAGSVVFVFSTTDRESFLAIESWKKKVDEECGDIPCVLVQNKIDMMAQAQVDPYAVVCVVAP
jgi:Ras-related protein Rab-23